MVFAERVSHITAQVEYGLIPADTKLRRYDENGNLAGNEKMELLSPTVFEDTMRGTFFFAERRPPMPSQSRRGDQNEGRAAEKKGEEEGLKRKGSTGKRSTAAVNEKGKDSQETTAPQAIPTLLEQLIKLGVLKIIPSVRCRSTEHRGACLVRVLLNDSEASTPNSTMNMADLYPRLRTHALVHVIHISSMRRLRTPASRYPYIHCGGRALIAFV